MSVRVHPNKHLVNAGVESCLSVTPNKKHGRAYNMGTVMLRDARFMVHMSGVERAQKEKVRNVHAWCVGDLVHEAPEQLPPSHPALFRKLTQVTYHYESARFLTMADDPNDVIDVTDGFFPVAYFCGRDFYINL